MTKSCAGGTVLVLAPSRAAADDVALEACGAALINVRRFAFREFVSELSAEELNRRGLVPVGQLAREALAARVTAQALYRRELTYLRPVAEFPGFARALAATFEELCLNAIDVERLRTCGESGPDLARLLDAYTRELSERRFADHSLRVKLAQDAVFSDKLRGIAVVTLDLAPRTRLERELLGSVIAASRATLELHLESANTKPSSCLSSLQRYLFSSDRVPVRDEDGSVIIRSTSGEALESVEIARDILAGGGEGIPFDQVGILLRSPERQQPLILEALRRAGIPSHCSLATRRPDVAGRSLLALLHCAAEGLSASRFAEYLSLGEIPEQDESATPALWERLLVDAAVIGGLSRWETRLAGLREELHRRHSAEYDEESRSWLARRIKGIENLTRLALPVIARLAAFPARAQWGEWIDTIMALAESALADPAHVIELLEELEPLSNIGPVSLADVLLVLGPRLNSLTVRPKESRFGKVWMGSVEEARGLAFRRVFIPGVNEGLFPRPPAEDPLLLEAQRHSLGIELRPEDKELFRIAAACASERLILSFARLDLLTGRQRVPSFYAFAAYQAARGREIGVREFELRARSVTETRIGWPAPAHAADAIDDAEFDLATLAPRVKGTGQYLKSLPGRSVDSLRARWSRWHKPWKAADGLFIEEIGSDALTPYLLSRRAWSPSALQQYARCPYRFALRGIHGLRPAEKPVGIQRMDPAVRGEIYHAAQFELLCELAESECLPVNEDNLATALDRLEGVMRDITQRFEADLAPAIPQIWHAEMQDIRGDLRGWLQQKATLEPDWKPQFYELSFGIQDPVGRDPRSCTKPVEIEGGFRLKGSIDLVERHSSGVLRVVDHKTGRVPEPRPELVGGGEILQPTLYALAAEEILGERVAFGRLFYSTIAQNYTVIDVPLNDWSRRRGVQVLRVINEAIRNGFLPAAPRKDGCRRCEYLPICGPYEEERVAEKSQPELKTLKELRAWR